MKTAAAICCLTILSSLACTDDFSKLTDEFFKASAALDQEYRDGKQDCQRRYDFKGAPERDSAKYKACLVEFDERFQKKRCAFYVTWYERSKSVGGLVQPGNYPKCAKYKY